MYQILKIFKDKPREASAKVLLKSFFTAIATFSSS